jgi:hypothetical protein
MKQLQELQGQKTGVEIIRPHAVHTKKSDVWSFAMVVYVSASFITYVLQVD